MKVYVVRYDWGSYGEGIEAIFSDRSTAEEYAKRKERAFGSYYVDEYIVDEEVT